MPCWTIQRSKTEFLATSTSVDILAAALRARGFAVTQDGKTLRFSKDGRTGTYDGTTGKLELPDSWDVDGLKRAYSEEVVNTQAKRFGWTVEWTRNAAGNREAKVIKRGR